MATNLQFIKSASGTASTLDVTNCFSDKYDVYKLVIPTFEVSNTSNSVHIRLLDSSSTVISASEYDNAGLVVLSYSSFTETRETGQSYIRYIGYSTVNVDVGIGATIYVYNPYDSSSYTFLQYQASGWVNGSGLAGYKSVNVHKSAEQITGFQLSAGTSTMDNIEVSVYGLASN